MSATRIIKKYPNRRLYDTKESRYITHADLGQLALTGIDFAVIEKATGSDITCDVLLQVLAEVQRSSLPLMTRGFLLGLIGLPETTDRAYVGACLERCISNLTAFSASQCPDEQRNGTQGREPDLTKG